MDNREIEEMKSFQNFLTKNLHNLLIKQRILGNGRWLSIISTNKQVDWPYFCILLKPKIFFWLICNCFFCSISQLRRSSLHSIRLNNDYSPDKTLLSAQLKLRKLSANFVFLSVYHFRPGKLHCKFARVCKFLYSFVSWFWSLVPCSHWLVYVALNPW